jgi:hypothetical protein
MAAMAANAAMAAHALAADETAAIPFRAADEALGRQAALAVGVTLLLLALASAALLALRRRFAAARPPAESGGLRSIASLRLPPQTRIHVIAYRDREWLLIQAGDTLQCLPGDRARMESASTWDAR